MCSLIFYLIALQIFANVIWSFRKKIIKFYIGLLEKLQNQFQKQTIE